MLPSGEASAICDVTFGGPWAEEGYMMSLRAKEELSWLET
jgi:hypothetical protein